jgi:hypothetical protein
MQLIMLLSFYAQTRNCELLWDNLKDNSLYKLSIKVTHDYVELNGGDKLLADGSKTSKALWWIEQYYRKKETIEP